MSITVEALKTAAIQENFNDTGSATSFITPTMYCRWINAALYEFWQFISPYNDAWYSFIDKTLTVVGGTASYDLDEVCAAITSMDLYNAPSSYTPIWPLSDPRHRRAAKSNPYGVNPTQGALFQWVEAPAALNASGVYVRKVEFVPTPSAAGTVYYDGRRYPTKIAVPVTVESTTYVDAPDDAFELLALMVEKRAQHRDKVKLAEINEQIREAKASFLSIHMKALQHQTSGRIRRTR